jgi:uncharacterized protein YcbK (DUF882 family)
VIIEFKRGVNKKLSNNFTTKEFECQCGKCEIQKVDSDLLNRLEKVRIALGSPIKIMSGYRCREHNTKVGGAPKSMHVFGRAADIQAVDMLRLMMLVRTMFTAIGDGRNKGFIHVDTRQVNAKWSY